MEYIPAIAVIQKQISKHYINFAVYRPLLSALIMSAVTLGVNRGLSTALTTADQVLNSLRFGNLLYLVTDNDKNE